jgi:hypothetical protein
MILLTNESAPARANVGGGRNAVPELNIFSRILYSFHGNPITSEIGEPRRQTLPKRFPIKTQLNPNLDSIEAANEVSSSPIELIRFFS